MNGQDEGKLIRSPFTPWLFASLVASAVPFVLLLLYLRFPQTRAYLTLGDDEFYLPGFGGLEPLRGASRTFAWSTAVVFWGIGFILSLRSWPGLSGWRNIISYLLVTLAVAALLFVAPMLSTIWALAIKNGRVPSGPWGGYEGIHGPWRHVYNLRNLLFQTLFFPVYALSFGILSVEVKSTPVAKFLIAGGLIVLFALFWSHYWLID